MQARRAAVTIGLPSLGREWKGWARKIVAIAGLITRVAWLIPYCARHHPLHLKNNGCRGSAPSPRSGQEGRRPQTARVITRCMELSNGYPAHPPPHFLRGGQLGWPSLRASTEHSIRLGPEQLNPVCATREHMRPPALQAPLVVVPQTRDISLFAHDVMAFHSASHCSSVATRTGQESHQHHKRKRDSGPNLSAGWSTKGR